MKKIGVITFSKSLNYGAFLQAYALQRALIYEGFDASLIDYETAADAKRYKLIDTRSAVKMVKSLVFLPINYRRKRSFRKCTKLLRYSSKNDFYDVAICGSDQIWNPVLSGNDIDPYFSLEKINSRRKVSYAASIGNESVVRQKEAEFKAIMNRLDYISVRELQAKKALGEVTNKPIAVTIDPTALFTREQWLKAVEKEKIDKNQYIFAYFIGLRKEQTNLLNMICQKTGLKALSYTRKPSSRMYMYKYCYMDGPFKFLSRLRDARLVITSSFHGTILSIILHKNFYVLAPDPKKRSRMDNILKLVGLTDRIIENEKDIEKVNLNDIDYTEPQNKLDNLRNESLEWLRSAVGIEDE